MSYINETDIESVAERVLAQANVDSLPIRADNIAEFMYDLEIDSANLDKCSHIGSVLAAISICDKKIYMNESRVWELERNPGRKNFTVAHELGHWILHKDLAQENLFGFSGNILICRGTNIKTDNKERQADIFATHLLMPERFVIEQLKNFETPLRDCDLKQIANIFRVSKQAIKIRLVGELKLLHYAQGLYYKSEIEAMKANGQQSLF